MSSRRRTILEDSEDEGPVASENPPDESFEADEATMMFSSQAPDQSQMIRAAKDTAKAALLGLEEDVREKQIMDLTRYCIFRSLAGLPITRADCSKVVNAGRTVDAVLEMVNERLDNLFGWELRSCPDYMMSMKFIPKKHKERYYCVNHLDSEDDAVSAEHAKELHAIHGSKAKGLLMVVLALMYCQGEPIDDSRWMSEADLYRLLHRLDENVPEYPPSTTKSSTQATQRMFENGTPQVDILLQRFTDMDYLVKMKLPADWEDRFPSAEEASFVYCMGPRSAIEVGRQQVVYFCAEVLDEEPDPSMLAELTPTQAE